MPDVSRVDCGMFPLAFIEIDYYNYVPVKVLLFYVASYTTALSISNVSVFLCIQGEKAQHKNSVKAVDVAGNQNRLDVDFMVVTKLCCFTLYY